MQALKSSYSLTGGAGKEALPVYFLSSGEKDLTSNKSQKHYTFGFKSQLNLLDDHFLGDHFFTIDQSYKV